MKGSDAVWVSHERRNATVQLNDGRSKRKEEGKMLSSILTLNCLMLFMGPLNPSRFFWRYFSSETKSRDVRISLVVCPTKESEDMVVVERAKREGSGRAGGVSVSPAQVTEKAIPFILLPDHSQRRSCTGRALEIW